MKKNTLQKTIALALTGAMAMGTLAGNPMSKRIL